MDATVDKATKKKLGSFYSPAILAQFIASKVCGLIPKDNRSISILDPAVGAGELLIGMFHLRQEPLDRYIGIDIDGSALENTRSRFSEVEEDCYLFKSETLQPKPILNVKNCDFLKHQNDVLDVNCIISNPPWGAEINLDQNELTTYETAIGQYDIYDLFIEKSLKILPEGGVYAFIVPDSIFRKEHKPIRKILLETTSIKSISRIGEFFFEGVNTSVSIIVGVKGFTQNNSIQCMHLSNDVTKRIIANSTPIQNVEANCSHLCDQDNFISQDYNFAIDIDLGDVDLMKYLDSLPKIRACLKSARGVELSKKGNVIQCPHCNLWQPFPSIKNKPIQCPHCKRDFDFNDSTKSSIIGAKEDLDSPLPFLRGEDLSRYSYIQKKFIETKKPGINYKSLFLYQNPKILVRKTGVGITAVLDYCGNVVNQVVYMLYLRDNVSDRLLPLELFIAILNSRIVTYYIIKKYGSTKWCTHPYVSQEMVENLPIPDFDTFSEKDRYTVARIKSIIKDIYDSSSKTPTPEIDLELERNILKLFRLDQNHFFRIMETIKSVEQLAPFRRLLNVPCSEWDLDT